MLCARLSNGGHYAQFLAFLLVDLLRQVLNHLKKENKLFGQVTGQPTFPLEATATNSFKFEPAGIVLEFDANKKQMILKQGGREVLFTKE